jgi:DNA-binding transcriptional LysR family regulator
LHLTHGAVSRAIRKLEDHLGVQLMIRATRSVRLTPIGASLAAEIRDILEHLAAATSAATGQSSGIVSVSTRVGGNHRLGMIGMIVNDALAALAGDFSALDSRWDGRRSGRRSCLRARLVQAFSSIRSERQLMERLEFDLFVSLVCRDRRRPAAWAHSHFPRTAILRTG